MLVLTRRKNEIIEIGHNGEIKVIVIEIRDDKVRIGIEAPMDVPVHRKEVADAIRRSDGIKKDMASD